MRLRYAPFKRDLHEDSLSSTSSFPANGMTGLCQLVGRYYICPAGDGLFSCIGPAKPICHCSAQQALALGPFKKLSLCLSTRCLGSISNELPPWKRISPSTTPSVTKLTAVNILARQHSRPRIIKIGIWNTFHWWMQSRLEVQL